MPWIYFDLVGAIETHCYRTRADLRRIEYLHPSRRVWLASTSGSLRIHATKALRGEFTNGLHAATARSI